MKDVAAAESDCLYERDNTPRSDALFYKMYLIATSGKKKNPSNFYFILFAPFQNGYFREKKLQLLFLLLLHLPLSNDQISNS